MNRSKRRPNESCAATHSSSASALRPYEGKITGVAPDALIASIALEVGIDVERGTGIIGHECAGHEPGSAALGRRDPQDTGAGVGIEELHVAGVHVDRGDEAGRDRAVTSDSNPGQSTAPSAVNGNKTADMPRIGPRRSAGAPVMWVLPGDECVEPVEQRWRERRRVLGRDRGGIVRGTDCAGQPVSPAGTVVMRAGTIVCGHMTLAFGLSATSSAWRAGRVIRRSTTVEPPHGEVTSARPHSGTSGAGGRSLRAPTGARSRSRSGRARDRSRRGAHARARCAAVSAVSMRTRASVSTGERHAVGGLAEHHALAHAAHAGRRVGHRQHRIGGSEPVHREVAAEAEPARVRELLVLRVGLLDERPPRRLREQRDHLAVVVPETMPACATRPSRPGRRSLLDGPERMVVGAASMVNAFMHQYGEPAELYDSAIRRLS